MPDDGFRRAQTFIGKDFKFFVIYFNDPKYSNYNLYAIILHSVNVVNDRDRRSGKMAEGWSRSN